MKEACPICNNINRHADGCKYGALESQLKDVLSDTTYYIRKERVEQLECELYEARQIIADARLEIYQAQQREARLLGFIADTERRAQMFMPNGSFTMFINEHAQLKAKALSTQSPGETMVPWSVVDKISIHSRHYLECDWIIGFPCNCGLEEIRKQLQSYAPKKQASSSCDLCGDWTEQSKLAMNGAGNQMLCSKCK